jgi:hypothetical protein
MIGLTGGAFLCIASHGKPQVDHWPRPGPERLERLAKAAHMWGSRAKTERDKSVVLAVDRHIATEGRRSRNHRKGQLPEYAPRA